MSRRRCTNKLQVGQVSGPTKMEDRNLRPNQTKYGGDDGRTIFVDDKEA